MMKYMIKIKTISWVSLSAVQGLIKPTVNPNPSVSLNAVEGPRNTNFTQT
jgi:hypothetical protein